MLYLDPHTTQVSGDIRERETDASYHIPHPGRISISGLDPSLALCFLCITEQEFDNLCIGIQVCTICCLFALNWFSSGGGVETVFCSSL